MERKDILKLTIVYIIIFFFAFIFDIGGGVLEEGNVIKRDDVGGDTLDVNLLLTAEDVIKDYELSVEIMPAQITKEEANLFFSNAMESIDRDFETIDRLVPIQSAYEDGLVEVEWNFAPAGWIESDGSIRFENLDENGEIITANAVLKCGAYEKIYSFPFKVYPPKWSPIETLEQELEIYLSNQQKQEGTKEFQLPEELGGKKITWREEKEYISIKILLLEIVSVFLLLFAKKKEKKALLQKRRNEQELQYPEIVNQLLILLEAGMTMRQAWHRIAYQYSEKRKKDLVEESEVYAAIVHMDRRLTEGENERNAYETFVRQMDSMSYRRLMRLLINNLEKGSKDICHQLNMEARQAYEQRLLLAKKLGEEDRKSVV